MAEIEGISLKKIDELNDLYQSVDSRTKVLQSLAIDLGQVRKEIQVKTDIRDRTIAEIEKLQKVDEMQIEIDVLQQSEHGIYLLKERYVKLTQ